MHWSDLSISELHACRVQVLREGTGSRPDVLLLERQGYFAVLKDQSGCDSAFAKLIGPLLAWREARALRRLQGIRGVPKLYARPTRRALVMEYIEADPIQRTDFSQWEVFFPRLYELLREMHERGVAHCDLRSPNNTLVGSNGTPALVDFVASVHCGLSWNPLLRWIFSQFKEADIDAVIKLKRLVAPDILASGQANPTGRKSILDKAARQFGILVRRLVRSLFTRSKG